MSVLGVLGLVAAGIGGGLSGSIAGLASLVTYPALLAFGLGPIAANVTNTVALVFNGIGATTASRPELVGQSGRLRRLVPLALLAGTLGAIAVLLTPSNAFARIVPWLIASASVVIVLPRRSPVRLVGDGSAPSDRQALPVAVFAVAFYGGYFGAAGGVMLLAILLAATSETLARANAAKNLLLGGANLAGSVVFAAFGPVRWTAAVPLAVGGFLGSRIGPSVVRRVPARHLRLLIGVLGVGLASVLGYRAYI
jgi:uncharacterized protein